MAVSSVANSDTFTVSTPSDREIRIAEYPSKDVRDAVLKSGMEKGAALSYDRLEEVAQGLQGS